MAYEKVTLYGVPIVAGRKVNYGRIDPELSRELFIRHALVEGDWQTHHPFFPTTARCSTRSRSSSTGPAAATSWSTTRPCSTSTTQRIARDVVSGAHFDSWWKKARHADARPADLRRASCCSPTPRGRGRPRTTTPTPGSQGELALPLTLPVRARAPTPTASPSHIPLAVLNQVDADGFDWQVPGLRHELVTALIRSLPKPLRRNFVPGARPRPRGAGPTCSPAGAAARGARARARAGWPARRSRSTPSTWPRSRRTCGSRSGCSTRAARLLAEGKDLDELRRRLRPRQRETLAQAASSLRAGRPARLARPTCRRALPRTFQRDRSAIRPSPATRRWSTRATRSRVRVLATEADQRAGDGAGTRRLLLLQLPSPARAVLGRLDNTAKLALARRRTRRRPRCSTTAWRRPSTRSSTRRAARRGRRPRSPQLLDAGAGRPRGAR